MSVHAKPEHHPPTSVCMSVNVHVYVCVCTFSKRTESYCEGS